MLESSIEKFIVLVSLVQLVIAYILLESKFQTLQKKLDLVIAEFNGLREYLYEIDPQFDDERFLAEDFSQSMANGNAGLSGVIEMELINAKIKKGKRTLNSPFRSTD